MVIESYVFATVGNATFGSGNERNLLKVHCHCGNSEQEVSGVSAGPICSSQVIEDGTHSS